MKKITKILMLMLMMAMLFAVGAYASGEPSDEPVDSPEEQVTSKTTIIYGGQTYVLDVYEIDGVEYVKLADATALLENNDIYDLSQDAVSGEPSAEASDEMAGEASGEPSAEASDEMAGEASGEPSAEASDEMAGEASGEPSAEASGEMTVEEAAPAAEEQSIDVTFRINGVEYQTAAVGLSVQDDTYTFQISALLDILGLELTYDEQADVAYLTAQSDGLLAALMGQAVTVEPTDSEEAAQPEQSAVESEEEAAPVQEQEETAAAAEETVPATDGTENQQNMLESTAAPETEEQFDAYKAYLTDYITSYTGTGDGTFDDGARDMALAELTGVGFGADVNAFPFEMFVSQFGALDYGNFAQISG